MTTQKQMLGLEDPGDKKVGVRVRDWNALKLAAWRNRVGWGAIEDRAIEIIERCKHSEGCAGKEDASEPCQSTCPDRELRMDALVMLNAARTCAPTDARKPAEGSSYFAPSREYFSEVLSELAAAQIENAALRMALKSRGIDPPSPLTPELPVATTAPKLEEKSS
jgi:hypothetical protein